MNYKAESLILTIDQLQSLTPWQRIELLQKMQAALSDPNMIMSEQDLLSMIAHLQDLKNSGELERRLLSLKGIDSLDLLSIDTNLSFSLAFVGNVITEQFDLCILTNKKYYNSSAALMYKYDEENRKRRLGSGAYKAVNSCLMLVTQDNIVQVYVGVRASALLGKFSNQQNCKTKVDNINNALKDVKTIEDVFFAINQFKNYFKGQIGLEVIRAYQEVKISRRLSSLAAVDCLRVGIPFLKIGSDGEVHLRLHIFDSICQHRHTGWFLDNTVFGNSNFIINSLYPDCTESEKNIIISQLKNRQIPNLIESMTDQLLDALINIHSQGFRHRDLKPHNLLLDGDINNPRLKIIDWGLAIDINKIRCQTKELARLLGFSRNNFGYVDGKLLDGLYLEYTFLLISKLIKVPKTLSINLDLTLDNLNAEVKKVIPDIYPMEYLQDIATMRYAAPEIAEALNNEYYGGGVFNCLSMNILRKMDQSIPSAATPMSEKYDVWAAGVSIVEYCLLDMPQLSKGHIIAFIENNLLLREMLHPNPKLRCKTADLQELRIRGGSLLIPPKEHFESLYQQYMDKIADYNLEIKQQGGLFAVPPITFTAAAASQTTDVTMPPATNKKSKMSLNASS